MRPPCRKKSRVGVLVGSVVDPDVSEDSDEPPESVESFGVGPQATPATPATRIAANIRRRVNVLRVMGLRLASFPYDNSASSHH